MVFSEASQEDGARRGMSPPSPGKGLFWGWVGWMRAITQRCSGYPGVPGTTVSRGAFTPRRFYTRPNGIPGATAGTAN